MVSGLLTKNTFLKDLQHGSNALVDLTTFGGFTLRPQHGKAEKATQLLSDGNRSDGDVLRPPTPQAPPPMTAQDVLEVVMLKNWIFNVEVPLQFHPSFHTPEFISMDVGLGYGFGGLEVVIACQVAREDLTIVKAKTSSSKHVQKRRIIAFTIVDNDLEFDADFSLDIVVVMQEGLP